MHFLKYLCRNNEKKLQAYNEEKVKALWKLLFQAIVISFIDIASNYGMKAEINVVHFRSEGTKRFPPFKCFPYPMSFVGKLLLLIYPAPLIDFRNRGNASALSEALPNATERDTSTLIPANPWLFDYYARIGYAPVFQYSVTKNHSSGFTFYSK